MDKTVVSKLVELNNLYEGLYATTALCGVGHGGIHIHKLSDLKILFPDVDILETAKTGQMQWYVMYDGVCFYTIQNDTELKEN